MRPAAIGAPVYTEVRQVPERMSSNATRHARALSAALAAIACCAYAAAPAATPATIEPGVPVDLAIAAGDRIELAFADCGTRALGVAVHETGIDVRVELAPAPALAFQSDDLAFPRYGTHRLTAAIDDCAAARLRVTADIGGLARGRIRVETSRFDAGDANADARLALALRETAALQEHGDAAARVQWTELAAAWSALGDPQRAGEDWFRAAAQSARADERFAAGAYFASAAEAAHRAGDLRLHLWARNDGAMNEWRRGEGLRAGALLRDVVRDADRLDDAQMHATVLNNYCLTDRLNTDLDQARACYEKALALSRASRDPRRIANVLNNLGGAHLLLGDAAAAKALFEESLKLKRQIGDKPGEALSGYNLGLIAQSQGRLGDALAAFGRARALYIEIGDSPGRARALSQIGNLQELLGARSAARETYQQALVLIEKAKGDSEVPVLLALARLAASADERSALVERAARRADAFGALEGRHYALIASVQDRIDRGRAAEATALLDAAGHDLTAANVAWSAESELAYARIAIVGGDAAAAKTRLASARALAMQQPNALRLSEILLASGEVALSQHAYADADAYLAQAATALEPLRSSIADAATRARFAVDHEQAYRLRLDALMERHRSEPAAGFDRQALLLADAERARSLREAIDADTGGAVNADQETAQANVLILAAARAGSEGDARAVEEIRSKLVAIEGRQALAALSAPVVPARKRGTDEATPAAQLDALRRGLGDDEAMIVFAFGRDQVYAFRIGTSDLSSFRIGTPERVRAAALAAIAEVRGDTPATDAAPAATELGRLLFAPMPALPGRVILSADGALLDVPFAALPLPGDGGLLLDHAEIEMAPSLSILAELRARAPSRGQSRLLVVADPVLRADDERLRERADGPSGAVVSTRGGIDARLYSSADEADAVSALAAAHVPTTRLEGFAATRERVLAAFAGQPSIMHFATHALTDDDAPESNGLVLSQFTRERAPLDGFIGLREIAGSRLAHGLVVLSACSTGRGANLGAEGTWGLVQAFMLAGSNQVVATLWDISDSATSQLMRAFYRELFVERASPPAALRAAQRELRATRRFRAPHYWAGFFASGVGQANLLPHF